jgi:pimeloyl-ACP methyl ester carboxylesterase
VTAFSPAGGWRTDEDYRSVATPFRIFHALVDVILLVVTLFAGWAWLRRTLAQQTMEHGDRMSADEFRASLRAMAATTVLRGVLRTMGRDGPVAPLDAGSVPIRIAWGDARYGEPMVERIRGAETVVVPGVGHVPMFDDPQRIADSILEVTAPLDAAREVPA